MGSSSTKSIRRRPTLLGLLLAVWAAVREIIVFPGLAAWLVALALWMVGLVDWLPPLGWCVAAPLLYLLWLVFYSAICAVHMQVLFWGYDKPRRAALVLGRPESRRHLRLGVCYARSFLIRSLPLSQALALVPGLRRLYLLSYAPRIRIGRDVNLWGFLHDPDLTEIGDDVVLGGGCAIAAHVLTRLTAGEQTYLSAPVRIGDRVTIGGDARIAMGVTIGADAIVEAFSNVLALTQIGPGEVWGGNPAVLLRHRSDLDHSSTAAPKPRFAAAPQDAGSSDGEAQWLDQAALLVARALEQPPEAMTDGGWDSLQQLSIALTMAETCDYRPMGDEIFELRSLADVARAMRRAGRSLGRFRHRVHHDG